MELSKRHHYLPQFYLKKFANPEEKFYIWLTKERRFKGGGKLFHPKSHFFEMHGNSVTYDSVTSDFVEKQMADIDDRVSRFYQKLNTAGNDYQLTDDEWQMLQYFITSMFWRLPCNEPFIKDYIKRASRLGHFGLKLMSKETNDLVSDTEQQAFFQRVKGDPEFIKFLKVNMPAFMHHSRLQQKVNDFVHIINFPSYRLPRIISDNPIILKDQTNISPHLDDMIFPLTPNKILFRNRLPKMITHSYVRVMIDAMLIAQSNEFVAATDLNYLPLLLRTYLDETGKMESLKRTIFENIGEKGEQLPMHIKYGSV